MDSWVALLLIQVSPIYTVSISVWEGRCSWDGSLPLPTWNCSSPEMFMEGAFACSTSSGSASGGNKWQNILFGGTHNCLLQKGKLLPALICFWAFWKLLYFSSLLVLVQIFLSVPLHYACLIGFNSFESTSFSTTWQGEKSRRWKGL